MAFKVVDKVYRSVSDHIRISRYQSNRASELGHPCLRYLVYCQSNWKDAKPPSPELQFIFEGGRTIEVFALEQLRNAGFKVSNQDRDYEDKSLNISGHVDCFLSDNGSDKYPCEIKGLAPWIFDSVNSAEDMLKAKQHFLRKYPAQLQLYLYLANKEEGLFYLVNKQNFRPKEIWMNLDWDFCDGLVKKAQAINQHLNDETLPDRIEYDEHLCGDCRFSHVCLPGMQTKGAEFFDSDEMEAKLNRREVLKSIVKEYEMLDEEVKATFKGKPLTVCGDFKITSKEVTRNVPAKEASSYSYWDTRIIKLK